MIATEELITMVADAIDAIVEPEIAAAGWNSDDPRETERKNAMRAAAIVAIKIVLAECLNSSPVQSVSA